jgi:hypothetical protein
MPTQAHKGGRGTAPTLLQSQCKKGVGGQHHAPATLIWGKTLYPLCRRLGGSWGQSGETQNISPPLGCDPRTVQPEASHYTGYVIYKDVPYVTIHLYNKTHLYLRLKSSRDNDMRNMWSSCGYTYCTYLTY